MTATTTTAVTPDAGTHEDGRRRYGRICGWAGLIGAAQALVLLLAPAQVPTDRFSYPFDVAGHALAQTSFAVQHVGLLAGLVVLRRHPAAADSRRPARWLQVAVVGMVLLAVMELVAILPAAAALDSPLAITVSALFAVPVFMLGGGLVVGGLGVARALGPAAGRGRWLPLLTGAWVLPVAPAMGFFVPGRIAIGTWMLLFAALGGWLAADRFADWRPR